MKRISASQLFIHEAVYRNEHARRRVEAMLPCFDAPPAQTISDAELACIVEENSLLRRPRHGLTTEVKPTVIFNVFRFDETEEEQARRAQEFPILFRTPLYKFHGHNGFNWRESGCASWRQKTGLVCQPAYQIHTVVGCPFNCAYCNLGWFFNVMLNVEDYIERLDGWIAQAGGQTLFQWDNHTDVICFEPEYGAAQLLVEYFAQKPGKYLEVYVGKSDNVDCLLDLDHRGKTVCCWSLSGRTQSSVIERKTASMEERVLAAAKCQEAGYTVRFRFSPIVPVRGWREEVREMIDALFDAVTPDMITFEPLRFFDFQGMEQYLDVTMLDEEFVSAMREMSAMGWHATQFPDALRLKIYRFVIDELERRSPTTPYALCREKRDIWDALADDFGRHRQTPDRYVCNCGPTSAPGHPLLRSIG
jgi:spore photoproduct lyase